MMCTSGNASEIDLLFPGEYLLQCHTTQTPSLRQGASWVSPLGWVW
jgi:hypothetical protein